MKRHTIAKRKNIFCALLAIAACSILFSIARADEPANDIGRVAARHLNATLTQRYFTYEASVDTACGKNTVMTLAASGTVNLDGWSSYRTSVTDYGNGPGEVVVEYYAREDVLVRRADTDHAAFTPAADTEEDAWYPAATDTFEAEVPFAPGHALLSLFDNTLPLERLDAQPGAGIAGCDMYIARWNDETSAGKIAGSISFCIDPGTQLARGIEAELIESGFSSDPAAPPVICASRLTVRLTPQLEPAPVTPPADVAKIYDKQTGRPETAAEPPPDPCDGPIATRRVDVFDSASVLPDGNITAFIATPDGGAYAGSAKGVAQFKGGAWTSQTAGGRLIGLRVNDIEQTADGRVWAATSGGLFSWNGTAWDLTTTSQGLPDNHVLALAVSPDRRTLYAATVDGIAMLEDGRWREYATQRQLNYEQPQDLLVLKSGLYAGTANGLLHVDRRMKIMKYVEGKNVHAVAEDGDEVLWAGVDGGAVALTGGAKFEYDFRAGLASNNVTALAVDAHGCLLAGAAPDGTLPGGLSRFHNGRWNIWPGNATYTQNGVRRIAPATDGSLWLVTDSAILHLIFEQNR